MGFYSRHVFPYVLEITLRGRNLVRPRREVLAPVTGRILEIGLGTGINLLHYPAGTRRIVGVDTNPAMHARARRREARAGIEVVHHTLSAEHLPFADASFDWVVSTFTLCTIPHPGAALAEVRRVLQPGGQLVFLEHGLAPDASVAAWQRRLNPLWQKIGDGCHLDRDTRAVVRGAGLELVRLRNFYLPGAPRFVGYLYLGAARKPTAQGG
jgi:SAM-dependent methyltransferase